MNQAVLRMDRVYKLSLCIGALLLLCSSFQVHSFSVDLIEKKNLFVQSATNSNVVFGLDPVKGVGSAIRLSVSSEDAESFGGLRTEIGRKNDYSMGRRWYAFSFFMPVTWETTDVPILLAQLHTSQKKLRLSPPVAVVARGEKLFLQLYSNSRNTESNDPPAIYNSNRKVVELGLVPLGRWACFVIDVDWSHKVDHGSMRVWYDNHLIYQAENTINSYQTWLGNYLKVGLYAPWHLGAKSRHIFVAEPWSGEPTHSLDWVQKQTKCYQS